MPIQWGKHDVHKLNIPALYKVVARNNMPSAMAVMAFPSLANIYRGLDLKTDAFALVAFLEYQVGISLIMIMLVVRTLIQRIGEDVGNEPGEIITLNKRLQWLADFRRHVSIYAMNNRLRQISGGLDLGNCKSFGQRHTRSEKIFIQNRRSPYCHLIICSVNE